MILSKVMYFLTITYSCQNVILYQNSIISQAVKNAKICSYLYFYYKMQVKQLFCFADFIGISVL